jgi:pimeloyl-ACP methyl ester carboxylesterase
MPDTPGEVALLAVALLAAGVVASVLHYLFWQRVLGVSPREDELLRTTTRDGWSLALGHRAPRPAPGSGARRPPVLLVHGIAMNRQVFDFGLERYSLAAYLAASGLDCYTLDLRGHGASRRGPHRRWNLDTYLREDVPAALDLVRARTGEPSVLWVGHSQGAILGLAASALYPERVRAVVALAGPAHFDVQERLRKLVTLRYTWLGRYTRLAARMVAPFSGYWHPAVADLAVHMRNVEPPVYRRVLANAIENLQPGVLEQFAAFIREDSFRSMDGRLDYRALLSRCAQPALFVSGEKDGLAPPPVVEAAFRRWGGPKRYWCSGRDYGHLDLILGRNAPQVVFPIVRDFLLEHGEPAGAAASGGRAGAPTG